MATKRYFTASEMDIINKKKESMGEEAFSKYVQDSGKGDAFNAALRDTYVAPSGQTSYTNKYVINTATKDDPIKERGTVDTTQNNNYNKNTSSTSNTGSSYTSGNNSDGTEAPDTPEYTNNIDQYNNQKANTEYNAEYQDLYDKYGQENVQFDDNGNFSLKETKLWEVMTNDEKREVYDQTIQDITRRRREWLLTFDEANAEMKKARADAKSWELYWGATMSKMYSDRIDYERNKLEKDTQKALETADDIFAADLEREEKRIRDAGKRVMDTTQRLNSLRGGGRSSANEAIIMEQQKDVNSLIASAQAKTDIALQIRKAEINGASAEAMEALTNQQSAIDSALNSKLYDAMDRQKTLNDEIAANFADGLQNMMDVLESWDVDTSNIDFDATLRKGGTFMVDKDGWLWINPKTWMPEYLKKEAWAVPKISTFKDGNGNTFMTKDWVIDSVITISGQYLTWDALDMMDLPTIPTDPVKAPWSEKIWVDEDGNDVYWVWNETTQTYDPIDIWSWSGLIEVDYNTVDFSTNDELIKKYPNEASFKNNNPTWITFNAASDELKALWDEAGIDYGQGTARPEAEGGNYVMFGSAQDGIDAYTIALTSGMDDVYGRLKQWVWTDEWDSYAQWIMAQAGIPEWTKFSEMNQDQLMSLMEAQLQKESPNYYNELINIGGSEQEDIAVEWYKENLKPLYDKYNSGKLTTEDWKSLKDLWVDKSTFTKQADNYKDELSMQWQWDIIELIALAEVLKEWEWRWGASIWWDYLPYRSDALDYQQAFDKFISTNALENLEKWIEEEKSYTEFMPEDTGEWSTNEPSYNEFLSTDNNLLDQEDEDFFNNLN